jgi:hypothetical protein
VIVDVDVDLDVIVDVDVIVNDYVDVYVDGTALSAGGGARDSGAATAPW